MAVLRKREKKQQGKQEHQGDRSSLEVSILLIHSFMQPAYLLSYKHWASLVAQSVKNPPAMQENWVRSLGQEDPLEKIWQPTAEFSPEESQGQRSLVGNSP